MPTKVTIIRDSVYRTLDVVCPRCGHLNRLKFPYDDMSLKRGEVVCGDCGAVLKFEEV